jgi:hypothetical protein
MATPQRAGLCVSMLSALCLAAASFPAAQAPRSPAPWTPLRTADGQPDLEGVWVNRAATPLERPPALAGRATLTEAEVASMRRNAARLLTGGNGDFLAGDSVFLAALAGLTAYKNPNSTHTTDDMPPREFDNRTSLVVDPPDGRVPPLTPEGRRRQTAAAQANFGLTWQVGTDVTADYLARATSGRATPASAADLSNGLRCITYGVPRVGGRFADPDFSIYRIVQAPGQIVMVAESIHDARVIPLDGREHLSERIRQWNGDSRGRWEGDTLVVDTANFSASSFTMGSADGLRIVERFTRTSPDAVDYEVTLTDPDTWTRPWTVRMKLTRINAKIFEFACHEGNYDMMRGVLRGARTEESR